MKDYHKLEEDIFKRWNRASIANGDGELKNEDGLLFRGKIIFDGEGGRTRQPGKEETLWHNAPKRLLFLTKETPDYGCDDNCWDLRTETATDYETDTEPRHKVFYSNYIRWAYGILNISPKGKTKSFEEASNWAKSLNYFIKEAPLARVNIKKQQGGPSTKANNLIESVNKYSEFVLEQISLYDADIFFCCGNDTYNALSKIWSKYLPHLEEINDWMYYSKSKKKLVINSWHPSARKKHKEMYDSLMEAYEEFLQRFPVFKKSCRNK